MFSKEKIEDLDDFLYHLIELVEEFNYKKNGVAKTKDFIRFLLFEFYKRCVFDEKKE